MNILLNKLPLSAKAALKRILRYPHPYEFRPARSIKGQRFTIEFCGRNLSVSAAFTTPLYETIEEVIDYDCYQLAKLDIARWAAPVIVDIGANIGVTALCLASFSGSQVICLEPRLDNFEFLTKNFADNKFENATLLNAALGSTDGPMSFWSDENQSVSGALVESENERPGTSVVQGMALATLVNQYCPKQLIDLLKLDCEGGEYVIVNQITPELSRRIRNITLEIHDQDASHNVASISQTLESLGYMLSYKPDVFKRRFLHHLLAVRID